MKRSLHRHRAKALPHDHLPLRLGLRRQVRISLTALAGTRSLSLIRARARARHIQVQSLPFTCILPQSHQLLVTHRLQITVTSAYKPCSLVQPQEQRQAQLRQYQNVHLQRTLR